MRALVLVDIQAAFDAPYWGARNNPQAEDNAGKLLAHWRAAGAPVLSAEGLSPGDGIALTFQNDGHVAATVDSVGGGTGPTRPTAKPAAKKPVRRKAKTAAKPNAAEDPQGSLL